jgi:hypothetical protein
MATQKKPTFKALARSVRKHLRQAERKARYEYLDAGKKMLEAKDKMGHDEFVQWTQQFSINADISWSLRVRTQKNSGLG